MSTARPLFSFLNISGAIYGYVPGPLLLDVIVTWAACFSSVTPIPQTNTPLRFLVIYQIRIQEKTARINLKLHLLCYLKLTSTFRGLYTQGIWLSIVLQQTLFWYILHFNWWPFRLATPSGSIMESNIWTILLKRFEVIYWWQWMCSWQDKHKRILVYLLSVSSYFEEFSTSVEIQHCYCIPSVLSAFKRIRNLSTQHIWRRMSFSVRSHLWVDCSRWCKQPLNNFY